MILFLEQTNIIQNKRITFRCDVDDLLEKIYLEFPNLKNIELTTDIEPTFYPWDYNYQLFSTHNKTSTTKPDIFGRILSKDKETLMELFNLNL